MSEARPIRWKTPLACALAGSSAFGASLLLARAPTLVEQGFARGISPLVSRPISLLTGLLPFSLAEVAIAAYTLWMITLLAVTLRVVIQRRRRFLNALAAGSLRLLRDGGLAVFLLYALWGFNYARPPLESRLGWPAWEGAELAEVVRLAEAAVATTNRAYLEIHGVEDAGTPTPRPTLPEMQSALDVGWARLADRLELQPSAGKRYGRVKQPSTTLLERLGIFGVYVPWTAEATIARDLPAVRLASAMGHEMAHQRGVAIEAEASFLGFLACSLSGNAIARYAGASDVEVDLISALPGSERRRVAALRLPGVVRDLRDLDDYGRRYEGPVEQVQTRVNDRYLRANRVPGGIQNYGRSVRLVIQYFREHPEDAAVGGILYAAPDTTKAEADSTATPPR